MHVWAHTNTYTTLEEEILATARQVCMYTCMDTHIRNVSYIMHAYVHTVCMHVRAHTNTCTTLEEEILATGRQVCMYICTYACMMCMRPCCVCVCVSIHIWTHVRMYAAVMYPVHLLWLQFAMCTWYVCMYVHLYITRVHLARLQGKQLFLNPIFSLSCTAMCDRTQDRRGNSFLHMNAHHISYFCVPFTESVADMFLYVFFLVSYSDVCPSYSYQFHLLNPIFSLSCTAMCGDHIHIGSTWMNSCYCVPFTEPVPPEWIVVIVVVIVCLSQNRFHLNA